MNTEKNNKFIGALAPVSSIMFFEVSGVHIVEEFKFSLLTIIP